MSCRNVQIIGGAGVGKTRALIELACRSIRDDLLRPDDLGMVSFTRAAAREARERLSAVMDEEYPWICTIHSVAYRALGLQRGDIGEPVLDGADEATAAEYEMAVRAWHQRCRLAGPESIERAVQMPAERLWMYIDQYEQLKRLNGVMDFTDLLARFAGIRFDARGRWETVPPDGVQPPPFLWFFDEQQDASPLLWRVCQRLCSTALRAWFCGDPFQSIYGWAGADVRTFMETIQYDEQVVLNRSYRVPSRLLELGETVIRGCRGYFDRGMHSVHEGGEIVMVHGVPIDVIADSNDVMVIARTNQAARAIGEELSRSGIPWASLSSGHGWFADAGSVRSPWEAYQRNSAYAALQRLVAGTPITGGEWANLLRYVPSRVDGCWILARGVKSRGEWPEYVDRASLSDCCGEEFWNWVESGRWAGHCEFGEQWAAAYRRYGLNAIEMPRVRLGTIHGAKGRESTVVVLDSTQGRLSMDEDEERRVWYVGVTRARQAMYVIDRGRRSSGIVSYVRGCAA